ncbi:NEDD8 activating enzyme [Elasticomyces elasticus]|nr:NEDD8 activating enzyme [Elasticomyces elasticus]KAK4993350.1 NEDD8 activating enzyme [Elasticomyces elasticus]
MATVQSMSVTNGDVGNDRQKWKHLDHILSRPGAFTEEEWVPGEAVINALDHNLALSGFKHIDVIDMGRTSLHLDPQATSSRSLIRLTDTIDVSNLNRQFLFRQSDVGKPKAEVAARFVEKRVKGVKINPYCGKIQDKDEDYYMQFNLVVCGLDSIEARRWINATLVGMVDMENQDSLKPLIDGGTEGERLLLLCALKKAAAC